MEANILCLTKICDRQQNAFFIKGRDHFEFWSIITWRHFRAIVLDSQILFSMNFSKSVHSVFYTGTGPSVPCLATSLPTELKPTL